MTARPAARVLPTDKSPLDHATENGHALVLRGAYAEALGVYTAGRDWARSQRLGDDEIRMLERMAWAALHLGRYDVVRRHTREGCQRIDTSSNVTDPTSRQIALLAVSSLSWTFEGDAIEATKALGQAKASAVGRVEPRALAILHRATGNLAMLTHNRTEAINAFERGLDACPLELAWERSIAEFNLGEALETVRRVRSRVVTPGAGPSPQTVHR